MMDRPSLGRVMLIDDEEIDQMIYKRVLQRSGLAQEVIGFTSAEVALEYLIEHEAPAADLILLDINMPRMTGFEFLEAVRQKIGLDFEIPVVMMLTTSLNPTDRARAESYDIVKAYVNKPLDTADLDFAAGLLADLRSPAPQMPPDQPANWQR